jgi:hypothetical protein
MEEAKQGGIEEGEHVENVGQRSLWKIESRGDLCRKAMRIYRQSSQKVIRATPSPFTSPIASRSFEARLLNKHTRPLWIVWSPG